MSTLYTNALDAERLHVFNNLSYFSDRFVLAGGTSIMLQIGHRISYDFDCFSLKPLETTLISKVKRIFGNTINVSVNNSSMLLLTTNNGVKIDFVHFPYKPISKIIKEKPISLFSLKDLAANKAHVIGRRATWRDYVDIFFLLNYFQLDKIISFAQKKYSGEFSDKLFLEQLVYFDDIDILPISFLGKKYTENQIKEGLKKTVAKYTTEIIAGPS